MTYEHSAYDLRAYRYTVPNSTSISVCSSEIQRAYQYAVPKFNEHISMQFQNLTSISVCSSKIQSSLCACTVADEKQNTAPCITYPHMTNKKESVITSLWMCVSGLACRHKNQTDDQGHLPTEGRFTVLLEPNSDKVNSSLKRLPTYTCRALLYSTLISNLYCVFSPVFPSTLH